MEKFLEYYGIKPKWVKKRNAKGISGTVYIKEEYQITVEGTILRSQQFRPKTPVEIWALCKPVPKGLEVKIERIEIRKGEIFLVDETNKNSPRIYIGKIKSEFLPL